MIGVASRNQNLRISVHNPISYTDSPLVALPLNEYNVQDEILGIGNYGCVRRCVHRRTGKEYAIKSINKSQTSIDCVNREIQLLSNIDHPNILKTVNFFEDVDDVHIITEMYTGGELFDKIVNSATDTGCIPERQAAKIVKSLLEAVQYLHQNNIVHRDIKPENIMFESNQNESIKLVDFGLSKRMTADEEVMTKIVGTAYYMSPSVLRGKYNKACDIWAVGIIVYIMLSGYPPFNGLTEAEIQRSVLKGELIFDDNIWSKLSEESQDFVKLLLSRDETSSISSADQALRHPWIFKGPFRQA